ncbi:DUF885 domain-containing protein [Taibaiella lutea]|uniref:DUF885 domain-containing protein n=1 Tax=Taibaiella lutea TaxID=2608001 RepID=A0A5M6CBY1_9BACT|nr:DUF885 domain-containing protein [Taibaiella lutea]KAA5532708.1 DUF885 domain-containing protein [Taibaiella lutea]
MKNSFYIAAFALISFASCNNTQNAKHAATPKNDDSLNISFDDYSNKFLTELWKQEPEMATQQGYHLNDSVLKIPNDAYWNEGLAFVNSNLETLKAFDTSMLTPSHLTDMKMIQNYLESKQWGIQTLKQFEWDPSAYNITGLIAFMVASNDQPADIRLENVYKRMQQVPAYYEAAKANLKNPVDELKSLGIAQNEGGLSVIESDFVDSVKASNFSEEKKYKMLLAAKNAAHAIKGYVAYLKSMKGYTPRSFRLGKDLYAKKFELDIQSNLTAEETYKAALERKDFLHGEMAKISKQLWPKYFGSKTMPSDNLQLIAAMIDTLSMVHVKPEDFQSAIEKEIPTLVQFIKTKNLLYIDSTKPLVIRKEPAYMAGVAGASISAPGPYDKEGKTYYNVGSLEGWPADKAESYLREYNQYILQILCIHEAIPGHYTQLVYANRSPSLIKAIFGNGAMVEGWAVYTEQMMLENGFGDNAPEMWLMWYKWHLRTVCNTILDYSVHAGDMSKEQAMNLLTQEAFQQQAEAEGKWKRVSVTSVQLTSYFAGYKAIYDLREKIKAKEGKRFDLRVFHEKFLSYGSAPVKYISALMLN